MLTHATLEQLAGAGIVDLYLVDGLPLWEASHSPQHQLAIDAIRTSLQPGGDCAGINYYRVDLRLGERTLLCPDIAIYAAEPVVTDAAVTTVPVAIIEVLHADYIAKDRALVPVYLRAGVLDVLLFDPESGGITHYSGKLAREYQAPLTLRLECGCWVTIA
jgi:Putative restriction endonuclease